MFRDLLEVYKYEATRVGDEKADSGGSGTGGSGAGGSGDRTDGFTLHTETLKQVTVLTIKALKHMRFDF